MEQTGKCNISNSGVEVEHQSSLNVTLYKRMTYNYRARGERVDVKFHIA